MENPFVDVTKEYMVGGQKLVMRPLPFLKVQMALALVSDGIKTLGETAKGLDATQTVKTLPQLFLKNIAELMPLLFDSKLYPFLVETWILENVTLPLALQIIQDAVEMNKVADFFGILKGMRAAPEEKTSPALTSAGSTTPSA